MKILSTRQDPVSDPTSHILQLPQQMQNSHLVLEIHFPKSCVQLMPYFQQQFRRLQELHCLPELGDGEVIIKNGGEGIGTGPSGC